MSHFQISLSSNQTLTFSEFSDQEEVMNDSEVKFLLDYLVSIGVAETDICKKFPQIEIESATEETKTVNHITDKLKKAESIFFPSMSALVIVAYVSIALISYLFFPQIFRGSCFKININYSLQ
jgi:hypothetical protein